MIPRVNEMMLTGLKNPETVAYLTLFLIPGWAYRLNCRYLLS